MLKNLMKKGGQLNQNEQVKMAEEKIKALQEQLLQENTKVKELEETLEKIKNEKSILANQQENSSMGQAQELNALREKSKKLQEDLEKAEETASVLTEILNEIRRLKMSPLRNLTGDSIDDLREERDRLIEENIRLKSGELDENFE